MLQSYVAITVVYSLSRCVLVSPVFSRVGNSSPRGLQKVAIVNRCLPVSEKLLTIAMERAVMYARTVPVAREACRIVGH